MLGSQYPILCFSSICTYGIEHLNKVRSSLSASKVPFSEADKIYPQADSSTEGKVLSTDGRAEQNSAHQNVHFDDAHEGFMDTRGRSTDVLRSSLLRSDESLQDFFSRPIKIASISWDIASTAGTNLNPWALFFENPRVINRISNHKLLKATLKVKVVLNGNAFYYGRALVFYQPLPGLDQTTDIDSGNFDDMVEASQMPHIWLNPTTSQGGEMILPFFTPLNMLDIPNQDWRSMGSLRVGRVVPLAHANGATSGITISIFAWAEDVALTGLTQTNPPDIFPQAKSEHDGIISKPASIVAKTASLFKSVPVISDFALATEIGASSIANFAALFGYSKPVTENIPPSQLVTRQSMALCDGRENLVKLTVDSKQEVSVDPAIASLDMPDELTIGSIAGRESLLTKFTWAVGLAPESLIFNTVVDPCVIRQIGSGTNAPMHFPALAFATFPFEYWKGTLRYRFQVVASGFHKGRLKIVYDPYGAQANSEYNVAHTHIVDISECNDFTVDVGWGQSTPWRRHLEVPQDPDTFFVGSTTAIPVSPVGYTSGAFDNAGNGVLSVYIVNELTVPDNSIVNDVQIIVSVSATDDYEVASPTDRYMQNLAITPITTPPAALMEFAVRPTMPEFYQSSYLPTTIFPQASDETQMNMDTPVVDSPVVRLLGSRSILDPVVNRIHMGETIVSFRQLLKRYCLHEVLNSDTNGDNPSTVQFVRRMFPFYGGYTLQAPGLSNLIRTVPTGNYVYAKMTLLHYLTRAFAGWRGGIRYCIDASFARNSTANISTWAVSRLGSSSNRYALDTRDRDFESLYQYGTSPTQNLAAGILHPLGLGGSTRWSTSVNPIQTFEIPYYHLLRFSPARSETSWQANDVFQDSYRLDHTSVGGTGPEIAYKYVAAAEDFTLFFYLAPPKFYVQDPPAPV